MNDLVKFISMGLFPHWHYVKMMVAPSDWQLLVFVHLSFAFYFFSFLQVLMVSRNLDHLYTADFLFQVYSGFGDLIFPLLTFVKRVMQNITCVGSCSFFWVLVNLSSFSSGFKSSVLLGDNNLIPWESRSRDSKINWITKSLDCKIKRITS